MKRHSARLFAVATLCAVFCGPSWAAVATRDLPVREVVVAFKTHFDIGYTDAVTNVLTKYLTKFVDSTLGVNLPTGLNARSAVPVNLRSEPQGQLIRIHRRSFNINLAACAPASFVLDNSRRKGFTSRCTIRPSRICSTSSSSRAAAQSLPATLHAWSFTPSILSTCIRRLPLFQPTN